MTTPADRTREALHQIQRLAHNLPIDVLCQMVDTQARASSTRDGYPSGGDGGPRGNSELTAVEASAVARMGRRQVDEYRTIVMGALDAIERALRDLKSVSHAPKRIEAIQTLPDELARGNDRWCWHARHLGLPYDTAWDIHVTSDLKGLWPEKRPVCRWVWDYHRDRGVLPSEAEMLTHLERGVVRVKAS